MEFPAYPTERTVCKGIWIEYCNGQARSYIDLIQDDLRRRCSILKQRANKIADYVEENADVMGEGRIQEWKATELRIFNKLVSLQRQRDCVADALKQLTHLEEERAHFKAVIRPRRVRS